MIRDKIRIRLWILYFFFSFIIVKRRREVLLLKFSNTRSGSWKMEL